MMRSHKKYGFTIIELTLSMSFVAMLLIAIALLTIQISNTYTRGVTMRQVNIAGQELSSDIQRTIQAAQGVAISNDFVIFTKAGSQRVYRGAAAYTYAVNNASNIMGGRLCLQDQSYAWNTGSFIDNQGSTPNNEWRNVTSLTPSSDDLVRFARSEGNICSGDGTTLASYPVLVAADTEELLLTADRNLAMHKFLVSGNSIKGLYAVSFTIGTNDISALEGDGDRCKPPSNVDGNIDYCAVNRFDIVARTVPIIGGP